MNSTTKHPSVETRGAVMSDTDTLSASLSCKLVRNFLDAMERRDLTAAQGFLSHDFEMIFPGGKQFSKLEDLVSWGKSRYRTIAKTFSGMDACVSGENSVVFCFGTLAGEYPDGTRFEGIRFIDRFTLRAGQIVDQQVWNDMGEIRKSG